MIAPYALTILNNSNDLVGGIHTLSQNTYLLGLSDGAVSVPAEDFISAQSHMSARNELEAGEEFHTLPGGVGDHTLYNAGMCTHTHAYAHNYPKNSRITIIPQNYKENIGARTCRDMPCPEKHAP
jgi:hypothetical protein